MGSARRAAFWFNLLGLFVGLHGVALAAIGGVRAPAAAVSVVAFPLIVLTAIALFRLGQLFIRHAKANATSEQDTAFKDRAIGLVGRAALPISLAAPRAGRAWLPQTRQKR